jgi:hypothetical protein
MKLCLLADRLKDGEDRQGRLMRDRIDVLKTQDVRNLNSIIVFVLAKYAVLSPNPLSYSFSFSIVHSFGLKKISFQHMHVFSIICLVSVFLLPIFIIRTLFTAPSIAGPVSAGGKRIGPVIQRSLVQTPDWTVTIF